MCLKDIQSAFKKLCDSFYGVGKLLLCGNGGSTYDCEHIGGELMKGFMLEHELPEVERNKLESLFLEEGHSIAEQRQERSPPFLWSVQLRFGRHIRTI